MILKVLVAAAIAAIICDVVELTPELISGAHLVSDHPQSIVRQVDEHAALAAELRCLPTVRRYDTNTVRVIGVNCSGSSHPGSSN